MSIPNELVEQILTLSDDDRHFLSKIIDESFNDEFELDETSLSDINDRIEKYEQGKYAPVSLEEGMLKIHKFFDELKNERTS